MCAGMLVVIAVAVKEEFPVDVRAFDVLAFTTKDGSEIRELLCIEILAFATRVWRKPDVTPIGKVPCGTTMNPPKKSTTS